MGQRVSKLRVLEKRLGRDAAHVQADTAPVLLLDDRDGLAKLGSADGGNVATRTRTKDDDIKVGSHRYSLVPCGGHWFAEGGGPRHVTVARRESAEVKRS